MLFLASSAVRFPRNRTFFGIRSSMEVILPIAESVSVFCSMLSRLSSDVSNAALAFLSCSILKLITSTLFLPILLAMELISYFNLRSCLPGPPGLSSGCSTQHLSELCPQFFPCLLQNVSAPFAGACFRRFGRCSLLFSFTN